MSCESASAALFIPFEDISIIAGFSLCVMNHGKAGEEE